MASDIRTMRDLLMPGLQDIVSTYFKVEGYNEWGNVFTETVSVVDAPMPTVPLPVAVAMGAAAAVMKNPVVSRRWWAFWE